MSTPVVKKWLDAWGYSEAAGALHRSANDVRPDHPYRPEILELLEGPIRAKAVFDVDGVPTVCFLDASSEEAHSAEELNGIRQRIWNQNLLSVVLIVDRESASALPVNERSDEAETIPFSAARPTSAYSRRDLEAGDLFLRHPDWFKPESRVDQRLLRNLSRIVKDYQEYGLEKIDAQYLMAQVLFVEYLEDRGIVSDEYRSRHGLGRFDQMVSAGDRLGIVRLMEQLKGDFNGDFLEPQAGGKRIWTSLPDAAMVRLDEFLKYTDLESRQQALWKYDFRYIPVELISGIYESFLSDDKRSVGAYYTPRHLAVLAIDQAFSASTDILTERVFDGACGSGILLTTAYRRMLAVAEAKKRDKLSFSERRYLLEKNIFGADLSVPACRVTAFSLYLSMLEGLQPADIALLTDDPNVKLPTLRGKNLHGGESTGDFFSEKNGHLAAGRKFTLALSNPPWIEPKKGDWLESDAWAKKIGLHLPRRQTAAAFMYRTREFLEPGAHVCLILPVSVIAATTSQKFVAKWLNQYRLHSLTNFGDLRKLLFEDAKQPCVIAFAEPREEDAEGVDGRETFEYWVPKADVSYAFGRLTMHSSDRHEISTRLVQRDNSVLTTLFWGTPLDLALVSRLRLNGMLGDLFANGARWVTRKGFHAKDSGVETPESAAPLRKMPFLDARNFDASSPVLDPQTLLQFPADIDTVAKIPESKIFRGPRILFVDGMTSGRSIRAVFSDVEFSFKSSIGVISGPDRDADLLRFTSAYLHSSLATYLQMLTAYQANFERERVTLQDVKRLPFVIPERHTNPRRATQIVAEVASYLKQLDKEQRNILRHHYERERLDALFFEYFGLGKNEQKRVLEVANLIAPNIQPSSYVRLVSPLTKRPSVAALKEYARALVGELQRRRDVRKGNGEFVADVHVNTESTCGPLGIIRLDVEETSRKVGRKAVTRDDEAVDALLRLFSKHQVIPLPIHRNLQLATDVVIRVDESFYLIKPLVTRLWMTGEAHRDAERVVGAIDQLFSDKRERNAS